MTCGVAGAVVRQRRLGATYCYCGSCGWGSSADSHADETVVQPTPQRKIGAFVVSAVSVNVRSPHAAERNHSQARAPRQRNSSPRNSAPPLCSSDRSACTRRTRQQAPHSFRRKECAACCLVHISVQRGSRVLSELFRRSDSRAREGFRSAVCGDQSSHEYASLGDIALFGVLVYINDALYVPAFGPTFIKAAPKLPNTMMF